MKLFSEGDFQGMANLYTEDCKMYPQGMELVEGRYSMYVTMTCTLPIKTKHGTTPNYGLQ